MQNANADQEAAERRRRRLAVLLAALMLCWPALYNRYPLIFPDTASYINEGRRSLVAMMHASHRPIEWMRTPIYSSCLFALHRNRTLWPVVPVQALLVSSMLWLVVRDFARNAPLRSFLLLLVALSVFSGLPWEVSYIMPDIMGPIAYLGLYLLVFRWERLSRFEAAFVTVLTGLAVVAHITHLLLTMLLCGTLFFVSMLCPAWLRITPRAVSRGVLVLVSAVALQVAVNSWLCDRWTLNVFPAPPFLTARLVSDGPAVRVLRQHCGKDLQLEVCRFTGSFPMDSDTFLWEDFGVLSKLSKPEQVRMDGEERTLLDATLHEYPMQQARISAVSFLRQMVTFQLGDFTDSPGQDFYLGAVLRYAGGLYARSRQAHNALPVKLFSVLQDCSVGVGLGVVVAGLLRLGRRLGPELLGLSLLIVVAVIANAALTAILSEVDSRYQIRVIWLLPFLAGLYGMRWSALRQSRLVLDGV